LDFLNLIKKSWYKFCFKYFIMRKIIPILTLILSTTTLKAQRVFEVDGDFKADFLIFVADRDYKADLLVHKVDRDYKARGDKGLWFFTNGDFKADFTVFFVDRDYKADLIIYYVDRDYKAGWRNEDKRLELDLPTWE
jgi:hypothetical protein